MKTLDLEKIPRENSNDSNPVWSGATLYFLSDRNGPVSLFSYDTDTKQVKRSSRIEAMISSRSARVPERWSTSNSARCISMIWRRSRSMPYRSRSTATCRALTPHLAKVTAQDVQNVSISPTGARLLAEAHGDIFTIPAEKGDTRNLTNTPGTAERDPAWSPDGKSIAYFSDASGEYQLYMRDQDGLQPPKVIDLGPDPSFFYAPHGRPIPSASRSRTSTCASGMSTSPAASRSRSTPVCAADSMLPSNCVGRPTRNGSPTPATSKTRCTPYSSIRWPRTRRRKSRTA